MRNTEELCRKICIPEEVTAKVVALDARINYKPIENAMEKLFCRDTWDEGREEIKAYLEEDEGSFKMLACMLRCCLKTYENYRRLHISEQIYVDTMKCFGRFINEHKAGYGSYAFDREWWTPRQIAGQLFRIGELEYEMCTEQGGRFIDIHIPSDARLVREELLESVSEAGEFFAEKFPDYGLADMLCHSWLLSPTLKELLYPGAKILEFQKLFTIETTGGDETEFMTWVFKRPDIALKDLPEDTSLQRKLKSYLLAGGRVADAKGILKRSVQIGK